MHYLANDQICLISKDGAEVSTGWKLPSLEHENASLFFCLLFKPVLLECSRSYVFFEVFVFLGEAAFSVRIGLRLRGVSAGTEVSSGVSLKLVNTRAELKHQSNKTYML